MSTVQPYLQSLGFLGNPWVILPVMAILLAIVVYRLRKPLLATLTRITDATSRRLLRAISWIGRNYLWFIVIGVLFGYGWIVWLITWELPFIADSTVTKLRDAVDDTSSNRSDDVRNYAYALGALLAGIAILATMPFALIKTWINERQATTAEQGHITDRLTKAIEQLGAQKTNKFRVRAYEYDLPAGERMDRIEKHQRSGEDPEIPGDAENVEFHDWQTSEETIPNLEVRLGAIYALERIAQDSERDHITVMETLCAYIRENAPASSAQDHELGDWPDYPENASVAEHQARDALLQERGKKLDQWADALPAPRVDIQAALTVIGRRSDDRITFERRQERPFALDLRRTNLQNADLRLAKLDDAILVYAKMDRAFLREARMKKVILIRARLEAAHLGEARLEEAELLEARMEGAIFRGARMEGAVLTAARMEGAYLGEARMEGAVLAEAQMEGAKLHSAVLKSAALTDTFADTSVRAADLRSDSVSQEILNNVFGDAATQIPDDLTRPDHWDPETLNPWVHDPKFEAWLKARRGSGA